MWTRRRFLLAITAGLCAGGGALVLGQSGGYVLEEDVRRRLRVLGVKEFVVLRALSRRLLAPDEPGAPTSDELDVPSFVDGWLAEAEPPLRRDLVRLLRVIEHATPLYGRRRRFSDLAPADQDAYLAHLSRSHLAVLREGLAGLKALCMMGYYRDPRAFAICGYEGPTVPRGWAGGESR